MRATTETPTATSLVDRMVEPSSNQTKPVEGMQKAQRATTHRRYLLHEVFHFFLASGLDVTTEALEWVREMDRNIGMI